MKDIIKNFKPLNSNNHRFQLLYENVRASLKNPDDGDSVGRVGDLSNMNALTYTRNKMINHPIGKTIIEQKPRIRSNTFDFKKLKDYPSNSFGRKYFEFMSNYNFSPEERPLTTYYTDIELAYILQRYKEIHDFIHTILGYGITVPEELAVKAFESLQLKIPSASLASITGSMVLLNFKEFSTYTQKYIPHIYYVSNKCEFIMNIYYENELEVDIDELRQRLGFISLSDFKY